MSGSWNSDAWNEDTYNGLGLNLYPVVPVSVDFFIAARPLLITGEMLETFAQCADVTIPCEQDTLVIPAEIEELVIV